MGTPKRTLLILDACVLIDYCQADVSVLGLINQHVGVVHVAAPVLAEVDGLDEGAAVNLGLQIVFPDFELAASAANTPGPLSFEDRLCLLLAKQKGWTCVTNDATLRRACEADGVAVLWGLEPLALAVEGGDLLAAEAIELAQRIHQANSRYITAAILQRFITRVSAR